MAYTNVWNNLNPTGAEAANTIDDIFRSVKLDLTERFDDLFAMPTFVTDPLRPYGLKFTDAQDAKIYLGDNAGTPRALILRNKADSTTYGTWNHLGFSVLPTGKIWLDGGGDTYWIESAANVARLYVGNVNIFASTATVSSFFLDFTLEPTKKLYVDGGGDSYIVESSANVIAIFSNATEALRLTSTFVLSLNDLIFGATKKLRLDGDSVGDTYIYESSANFINTFAGGTSSLSIQSTGVGIRAQSKLYLDGTNQSGNTYIQEVTPDDLVFVVGGITVFEAGALITNISAPSVWISGTITRLAGAGASVGFFGNDGSTQQTITGSRGGNAALASLLTKLALYNIIVDGSSA